MSASSEYGPRGSSGLAVGRSRGVGLLGGLSVVPPGSTTTDRGGCDTSALLDVDGGAAARVTASVEVVIGGDAEPPSL
jgi:hypothetical protein